jgi:hypothetical protein
MLGNVPPEPKPIHPLPEGDAVRAVGLPGLLGHEPVGFKLVRVREFLFVVVLTQLRVVSRIFLGGGPYHVPERRNNSGAFLIYIPALLTNGQH